MNYENDCFHLVKAAAAAAAALPHLLRERVIPWPGEYEPSGRKQLEQVDQLDRGNE